MKNAAPRQFGQAARKDRSALASRVILPFSAPEQNPARVSPDLARVSQLTRSPADRIAVGRHVRRWRIYLREVA